jgi:hypothetical protein
MDISEMIIDSALTHYCVRCVARFNFSVDSYVSAGDRAIPNIVVAFAASDKSAIILLKNFPDGFLVFSH